MEKHVLAITVLWLGFCLLFTACHRPHKAPESTFAKGADVSWVTELEADGYTFRNRQGQQKELMQLLRDDCGLNAVRLRVWVNPENDAEVKGWCNIDDMVAKAKRAHDLGLRIMVDFHFSDRWADPGQQFIPAAWQGMDLEQTKKTLAAHVTEALSQLKALGIEPEWVQVGNETQTGMLWPLGHIDKDDNFTQLVNAGYDAVKAVFPAAKVIVHCDQAENRPLYDRLFGKLEAEGARYDMIGVSTYPWPPRAWRPTINRALDNMKYYRERFRKPVIVAEVGMEYDHPVEAAEMLAYLTEKSKEAGIEGIFWWEPEAPAERGYKKGCFDNGAPTQVFDCFITDKPQDK